MKNDEMGGTCSILDIRNTYKILVAETNTEEVP